MQTVFIHTNNSQLLGAHIAKYAIESRLKNKDAVTVQILNVDELPIFKSFFGTKFLHSENETRVYKESDLQSFTLSRFMPPALMDYRGRAVVIDPDVFFVSDIEELFNIDMQGKGVAVCRKKTAWDTSVMLMDCAKLTHWKLEDYLRKLKEKTITYSEIMDLKTDEEKDNIVEIPRIWNSLDTYVPKETRAVHMTVRLTQPWKTGLPIDFTFNKMPKYFGLIPREPIHKILGKRPTHYQPHPKEEIEELFFTLAREAVVGGAITQEMVQEEVEKGNVRKDLEKILFN